MPENKRKSSRDGDSDSSLSSLEEEPPTKQLKSQSANSVPRETSSNGDKLIDLTGRKYACVRAFRGRVFVDIREYYEDKSGEGLKPGKKGISLNREQWDNLKDVIGAIDSDLRDMKP
uniref:PC4 domain-containing protein n=1 Tax=Mesocestoides corti TaxID=53468 RepID=A0A5K3FHP5_MESCO